MAGEYNGELSKIKAMVAAGHTSWDVVEVESPELLRGCEEGLFEKLDLAGLGDPANYVPGALNECGVATYVWSMVLAYDQSKLAKAPSSWADFWNVAQYPGKRGLRKGAKYTLEIALLADGVKSQDLYKVLNTPRACPGPSPSWIRSSRISNGGKPAPNRRNGWWRETWR